MIEIDSASELYSLLLENGFKDLGEIAQNFNTFVRDNYYIFAKVNGTYTGFDIIYNSNDNELIEICSLTDDHGIIFKPEYKEELEIILKSIKN